MPGKSSALRSACGFYPVTLPRHAMTAADHGLTQIAARGTQEGLLGRMHHPATPTTCRTTGLPDYDACTVGLYTFEI
jgi:hypothetical protein